MKTYNVTLKASDNYITLQRNYQLSTQAVVNFNVITNPPVTKLLINNGSKLF
jgi:hypothetical protein